MVGGFAYGWIPGMLGFALLSWLGLPGTFSFWPLLFICLVPFLICSIGVPSLTRAFFMAMAGGIVFYVLQLYWIVSVLTTFGGLHVLVAVLALLLLVVYMSVYLGIFAITVCYLHRKYPALFLIAILPAIWTGLDWIRSWLFTGFPWMDFGYGLWQQHTLVQVADLFGHHGLSFLIVLVNTSIFIVAKRHLRMSQRVVAATLAGLVFLVAMSYSSHRSGQVLAEMAASDSARIGIVQGNIEQGRKWSPEDRAATMDIYLELSEELVSDERPDLIIWPETAMPFFPTGSEFLEPVTQFVHDSQTTLLSGAPWYTVVDWDKRIFNYYNAAFLLPEPEIGAKTYFKSHLVPYGEYVPLKKFMPFLAPLVEAAGDFTAGEVGRVLEVGMVKGGVLICFESIFPAISRTWVTSGANILVNLTNDAWYGKSSAPHQSWAMTVVRAVETRRSLVRAANTGVSGGVNPVGRVLEASELFVPWVGTITVPLMDGRSPYVRWGWMFGPLCAGAGIIVLFSCWLVDRRQKNG